MYDLLLKYLQNFNILFISFSNLIKKTFLVSEFSDNSRLWESSLPTTGETNTFIKSFNSILHMIAGDGNF